MLFRSNDELRERNKVSALEEQVKFEREKAYEDRAALADAVARMADLAAQLELAKAATAQVPGTVETAKAHFETHDQAENLRAEVAQLHHAAEAMATDFANVSLIFPVFPLSLYFIKCGNLGTNR